MNNNYGCQIESFDPFIENSFFSNLRARDFKLKNEVTLKVNDKWRFHRIGLVGDLKSVKNVNQIGWMARLDQILNYTQLNNKVIDIFKMDIENGEWEFLLNVNVDYLCKYVKQFLLETHTAENNRKVYNLPNKGSIILLQRLEKCFLLYHRKSFFFKVSNDDYNFNHQLKYLVEFKQWENELEIFDYMVTYGNLYFVNINFLYF